MRNQLAEINARVLRDIESRPAIAYEPEGASTRNNLPNCPLALGGTQGKATMTHTPGPWHYIAPSNTHDRPLVQRGASGGFLVADLDGDRAIADGRLIAAAPDLLAALEKSIQRIEQLCNTVNTLSNAQGLGNKVRAEDFTDVARAAIARAKG